MINEIGKLESPFATKVLPMERGETVILAGGVILTLLLTKDIQMQRSRSSQADRFWKQPTAYDRVDPPCGDLGKTW